MAEQPEHRHNAELQGRLYDEVMTKGTRVRQLSYERLIAVFAKRCTRGRLLDIGCGDGHIVAPLKGYHELHAVEASSAAAELARAKGIVVDVCDAESALPFERDFFDIVVASEVIEHVVRTDHFLHEINRVLKLGGHLILTTPNVASLTSLAMMIFMDLPPYMSARYRSPHVRDFTIRTMKMALGNHGFKTLEVRGGELMLPYLGHSFPSIGYFLPRLSTQMIVFAEKEGPSKFQESNEMQFELTDKWTKLQGMKF